MAVAAPFGTVRPARALEARRAAAFSRTEIVLLALIFGIALALRLWRIDLARVDNDESNASSLIAAWLLQGHFPLAGTVSSAGVPFTAGWSYILATGLLIQLSPYAALAVGIVWGLLAVGLCWWVGRRWLGPWGGLGAAAYYAASFYPAFAGRTAWQPSFLPTPALLCLDAVLMLTIRRRPWALVLACAWLGLMVQFHFIAGAYALLLLPGMWRARRSLRPAHLTSAALAGLAPLVPFLLYELHPAVRFHDLAALTGLQSSGSSQIDGTALASIWNLAGNGGSVGYAAPSVPALAALWGRWTIAAALGSYLAAAGLLTAIVVRPRGWRGWLIVLWAAVPVIALSRHSVMVYAHYLYLDMPIVALGVGALVAAAVASRRLWLQAVVGVALAANVAASAASTLTFVDVLGRADTIDGYGIPLRYSLEAGQAARALVPSGGTVLVGGQLNHTEVVRFAAGYDVPSTAFDDCHGVPYQPNAVYVLLSERGPGVAALSETGAPLLRRIERPGGDAFRIYGSPPAGADVGRLEQARGCGVGGNATGG